MSVEHYDARPVRRILAAEGRTIAWLARQTGLSHSHLCNLLAGRHPTLPRHAEAMARALGRDFREVFPAPNWGRSWDPSRTPSG